MYNDEGYFEKNPSNVYDFSNKTAAKNADGSITLHLGGGPNSINYIPIAEGWNYVVRMYQPQVELLNGTWTFPSLNEAH